MARGERPIKLGYSWFSAKTIEVVPQLNTDEGKALERLGGREIYQPVLNSEYRQVIAGRQSMGAKVRGREGKSPDRRLRSPSHS